MAWNPDPKVAVARDLARQWKKQQIIILAIDDSGVMERITFGLTKKECDCAALLGDEAFRAISTYIKRMVKEPVYQNSVTHVFKPGDYDAD